VTPSAIRPSGRINQLNVAMLVIETAFSNREKDLARRSLHLSPTFWPTSSIASQGKNYPIYITHTKPAETELIMAEIQRFDQTHLGRTSLTTSGGCVRVRSLNYECAVVIARFGQRILNRPSLSRRSCLPKSGA
jgi:hypothetical protein